MRLGRVAAYLALTPPLTTADILTDADRLDVQVVPQALEVIKRIRGSERTRRIPVTVRTSSQENGDLIKSCDVGANSYVRKPVNFEQFVETVRQLGMYWLLLNEPPPFKEEGGNG